MCLRSVLVWSVVAVSLLGVAASAHGQNVPIGTRLPAIGDIPAISQQRAGFYAGLVINKFINSFASYQFPDPDTGIDPLSRLEFPIDQWFIGIKATNAYKGLSVNVEVLRNLTVKSSLKTQDSDWEDPTNPTQKTTFSETESRLPEAWLVDINADWVLWWQNLRPVCGLRWQTFRFFGADGFQNSFPTPAPVPLLEDTFDVRFYFKHLYVGGVANIDVSPVQVTLQADYAWVIAEDADRHLLRGDRLTKEFARGWCFHAASAMGVSITDSLSLWLQADFKRIRTQEGSHQWWDDDGILRETWEGAKIWSDQQSVSARCELLF